MGSLDLSLRGKSITSGYHGYLQDKITQFQDQEIETTESVVVQVDLNGHIDLGNSR